MAAESLLLTHQVLINQRSSRRAPPLTSRDRVLLGLTSLFLNPRRISQLAVILKPATLLPFPQALVPHTSHRLCSSSSRRQPGPHGPSPDRRNPRFGCPRIAQHISRAFGIEIPSPIIMSVHESLRNRHTGCGKAPLTTPNLTSQRTAPLWLRSSYLHGMFDSLPWSYPDATLTTSRRARMEDSHKETGRLGPPNSESDSWKNMPILWRGHLSTRCENRQPIR